MATLLGLDLAVVLLLAGALLVIGEALAPGAHFIVLGIALLVAGLVGLALPPSLGVLSVVIMAGLVIGVGGLALFAYRQFDFYGGKGSGRTSDSDSLKGRTGRVTERVTATDGEVKLDDGGFNPYYRARTFDDEEIPEGAEVIVMDPGGGNVLTVASVELLDQDEIDRELAGGRASEAAAEETESDGQTSARDRDPERETDPA